MNFLILGGLGFLGVNITRGLLKAGHSVTVVDMAIPSPERKIEGCKYVVSNFNQLMSISSEFDGIDVVIHLISTTLPATSNINIEYDISTNLTKTVELLKLCTEHKVGRIVFSSSGGTVYGIPETTPISEIHTTNPICSYGIVKLAIEKYLQLFYRLYGLDYRVLRISNPYGPYQNYHGTQGSVGIFIWKTMHDESIEIWGDGSVIRDYIYIEDVVNAFIKASCSKDDVFKIYNIGSGHGLSLNEILEEIQKTLDIRLKVKYTSKRDIDVPVNILDTSLAKKSLGWWAETSLKEGILRTSDFIDSMIGINI